MNILLIPLKILIGTIATWIARREYAFLVGVILINMVLISELGAKYVEIFGFITNAGNVYHAVTLFCMSIIVERFSRQDAFKAVNIVFLLLVYFAVSKYIAINLQPTVDGNEVVQSALLNAQFNNSRILVASFAAFWFVNWIFIMTYDWAKNKFKQVWSRMIVSCLVAQFYDSVVFFSLAFFGILPLDLILEFMIVGFFFKSFIHIMTIPIFNKI